MKWQDKEITEKQKGRINKIQKQATKPIPKFNGTTRGEAQKYITKYSIYEQTPIITGVYGRDYKPMSADEFDLFL